MAVLDRLPAVSPSTYRRLTVAALWSLVFIVVTGAGVRLTGSGLGCSTWPGCEPGEFVPRGASSINPWIEFANRLVTGVVSVAVALAVLGSVRRTPRRRDLTLLSWGLVAGVVAQILLGAVVVWLHVHPVAVQGHFALSAVLVADAVVLHHRSLRPDGPDGRAAPVTAAAPPAVVRLARWAAVLATLVMAAGTLVTASGPHAGDEDAERLALSVRGTAQVHSILTWVFLAVVVVLLTRVRGGAARDRGSGSHGGASPAAGPGTGVGPGRAGVGEVAVERANLLLIGVVLQGALGYVQYFTGVPELLVGLHVLGSMLVWAATLRLLLALAEPLRSPSGVASGAGTGPVAS